LNDFEYSSRVGYTGGMNPKAAETWNFALAKLAEGKWYLDAGEEEPAKIELAKAVYMAAGAIYYLLGKGNVEQAAYKVAQGFVSDLASEDVAVVDALIAATKILATFAELSPQEDRLPAP
jgi:hypothetical protein